MEDNSRDSGYDRNSRRDQDSPVHSRLFIVCERTLTEADFKDAFSEFGTIEFVRMPRDHNTGETKGIVFIKFSKTSEAAVALETMSFKVIGNSNKPLKIFVASHRSSIQNDDYDEGQYKRLFLHIPKTLDENALTQEFTKYGYIESVFIQRDRETGASKGFAYIKFGKFSHAALAYEGCDKKYRAIFAQPRASNKRSETSFESNINNLASSSTNMKNSLLSMMNTRPEGYTRVDFMCSPYLNRMQIDRLFDIIPGKIHCHHVVDLLNNFGKGTVSFSNPVSAAYAVEKLNQFEYPPGIKIFVRPDKSCFNDNEHNMFNIPNAVRGLKNAIAKASQSRTPDLAQLTEAIAEASKLIKMATAGVSDDVIPDVNDLNYCSAKLPPPQPLADVDSVVAKRCFLVCKPQPPPLTVLRDIFCRFGDLINVYTLPNKTIGYARYASEQAADNAIKSLHGAEVCGIRIKVLEAEEEAPNKRVKYE